MMFLKVYICFLFLVGDLENVLTNVSGKDFKEKYNREKPDKNFNVIFSCRSGRRSRIALEKAVALGYKKYVQKIQTKNIENIINNILVGVTILEVGWIGRNILNSRFEVMPLCFIR